MGLVERMAGGGGSVRVCMYVIFIRCDKRTSNNKHNKQSQNDVHYKAAKPKNYLKNYFT